MPEYRRWRVEGGIYFFTVVTFHRRPILTSPSARNLLHIAWEDTRSRFPFSTVAICLLPDHIHCIWKLPEGDSNYSIRWKEIKKLFTKHYLREIGTGDDLNLSRVKRKEAAIWQRRFWEHTITDETDLEEHLDYIHYNPVKHGYVEHVMDWHWSSFQKYVDQGIYTRDWCGGEIGRLQLLDCDLLDNN